MLKRAERCLVQRAKALEQQGSRIQHPQARDAEPQPQHTGAKTDADGQSKAFNDHG